MSEIKKLTKNDIINGKNVENWVYFEELKGELKLRPLTDSEYIKIDSMKTRGMGISGVPGIDQLDSSNIDMSKLNLNIDMESLVQSEFEADCLAVSIGLVDDEGDGWSVDEVKGLRPVGIIKKIAEKIYELSGVDPKKYGKGERSQAVKQFRKE